MKTFLPVVDVIILSWGRKELVLETIANIQTQTGVISKIWVVDQGSDDETLQALRSRAAEGVIELNELGRNTGVCAGKNRAMALGQSEVIVSIDNDAVFESVRALAYVVKCFDEDEQLGILGFRLKNYYSGHDDRLNWAYPRQLWARKDQKFTTKMFAGVGHAVRRSALQQTKGYDERLFAFWDELDLAYQVISLKYHIVYDPAVVVLHKVSPEKRKFWHKDRYYYLVRNAIYLNYKYSGSRRSAAVMAVGYLVKGAYNRLFRQPLKAIWDAAQMIRALPKDEITPLNDYARAYIAEHDLRYRGSTWERFRREVLERLPQ